MLLSSRAVQMAGVCEPGATRMHVGRGSPAAEQSTSQMSIESHLEARHDAGASGQRQQLQLHAAHPAHLRRIDREKNTGNG